jgi:acyl-CoA synthetase (NDP forming)
VTTAIISQARQQGRTLLNEIESKQLLAEAGIPVVETQLAASPAEAVRLAQIVGYPAVLKVVSSQVSHKSDVGGVRLDLTSDEDVAAAYDDIVATVGKGAPDAKVDGVSVQRMADPGIEVIVGMTTDPQFGPVLMFGLGGILVEVLHDVAFRVVPIERQDATAMIEEIQGRPALGGYRGQPPADIAALEDILLNVSSLIERHPEIRELDLNPIFCYETGAVAVDARIVISEEHE